MYWKNRKYYAVSFDWKSTDMRIRNLKLIDGVKINPFKPVPKQNDELEKRGQFHYLIGISSENFEAVEYELRKAERNDDWCHWKEIKRVK